MQTLLYYQTKIMTNCKILKIQATLTKYQKYNLWITDNIKTHLRHIFDMNNFGVLCIFLLWICDCFGHERYLSNMLAKCYANNTNHFHHIEIIYGILQQISFSQNTNLSCDAWYHKFQTAVVYYSVVLVTIKMTVKQKFKNSNIIHPRTQIYDIDRAITAYHFQ